MQFLSLWLYNEYVVLFIVSLQVNGGVLVSEKEFPLRNFNPVFLRRLACGIILWVVFATLVPAFFVRILHVQIPYYEPVSWFISLVSFFGLTVYLSKSFLRDRTVSRLVFSGLAFLFAVQIYRIGHAIEFFIFTGEALNRVRALDNLISGLGFSFLGLAFLYVIIEILASRQKLLEEHANLRAEVAYRKKVEKHLREREVLIQGISTSALDGIIVIDNMGRVTYWNSAAEQILGFGAAEMQGRPVHELIAPPELQARYDAGLARWRETGQGSIVGKTTPLKARTKSGALLDIELSVSSMEINNQWHAVGILRDVSQRNRAEQEYRTILETTRDGFWIVSDQGNLVDVNQAYALMSGYSREELAGMSVHDLEALETPEETRQHIAEIRRQGADCFETRHRRKDGTLLDVEISVSHNALSSDRQYVFIRDITERKRLEQERRELEEQIQYSQKLESLGILAGGIAHDFNNILQIILGNVNMLEHDIPRLSPSLKFINNLKKSVDRASALTAQMLAYSGRRSHALQPIQLGEIVPEIINLIQSSTSKKILLKTNLSHDLPAIEGDRTQIEQVVMNLILNATEALDDEHGGVVSISAVALYCSEEYLARNRALYKAAPGNYVCFEVADTGCGMGKETYDKLFDPFYSTKFTGRGMGMSAVLGIMIAHKGAIIVESTPGQGTMIRALFPKSDRTVQKDDAPPDQSSSSGSTTGRTVLVVDDEPEVLDLGFQMLEELGYRVLTASDGLEAITVFRAQHDNIDCVLLDLNMPRMDGLEALTELRHIRPDIRVVIVSGYSEQDIGPRFTGRDISSFLAKPFDLHTLETTLNRVMN